MNKNVAFAAIFLTMMGGCASAPTQEQTAHADYGAPMSPEQCTMLVEEVLRRGLRDPEAAEFHHGPACHQGWGSSVPIFGMKAIFGYTQRGEIKFRLERIS